jgi:hypothetical protein
VMLEFEDDLESRAVMLFEDDEEDVDDDLGNGRIKASKSSSDRRAVCRLALGTSDPNVMPAFVSLLRIGLEV